jgi:hypothetical protein
VFFCVLLDKFYEFFLGLTRFYLSGTECDSEMTAEDKYDKGGDRTPYFDPFSDEPFFKVRHVGLLQLLVVACEKDEKVPY